MRTTIGSMRVASVLCAAATALALLTGSARAQESPAQAMPDWGPATFNQIVALHQVTTRTGASPAKAYPTFDLAIPGNVVEQGHVLPSRNVQDAEQTASTLPAGFEDGSLASQYTASVERYFAEREAVRHQQFAHR